MTIAFNPGDLVIGKTDRIVIVSTNVDWCFFVTEESQELIRYPHILFNSADDVIITHDPSHCYFNK